MIRVAIYSEEPFPSALLSYLKSEQIEASPDAASAELIIAYVRVWNRSALLRLHAAKPSLVLCSRAEEPFSTNSVLRNDVAGILSWDSKRDRIVAAIRAIANGLRILPEVQFAPPVIDEPQHLTQRELEVLRLIADGEGNKTIAEALQISEHTVKFHISSIFEKLHVSSRTEAVKEGINRGLISI